MKFKITKRMSLDFLGAEWKEAYINFSQATIRDIKDVFPKFGSVKADTKNVSEIEGGFALVLSFLKDKFINGKAVAEDGSLVDLKKDDLEDLPGEVLSRAISFLSGGVMPDSPKPSEKSLPLKG